MSVPISNDNNTEYIIHKCTFCQINPRSHSFREIRTKINNGDGVRIFYSRPADAELYHDTASVVHHFECELSGVGEWEWIFDCSGMGIGHYMQFGLVRELCRLFSMHGGLRHVKIINSGWLINMTIRFARSVWSDLPVISSHPDGNIRSWGVISSHPDGNISPGYFQSP